MTKPYYNPAGEGVSRGGGVGVGGGGGVVGEQGLFEL